MQPQAPFGLSLSKPWCPAARRLSSAPSHDTTYKGAHLES